MSRTPVEQCKYYDRVHGCQADPEGKTICRYTRVESCWREPLQSSIDHINDAINALERD